MLVEAIRYGLLALLTCGAILATDVQAQDNQDTTAVCSPISAAWRSAVLPGWGQIHQERLVPGAVYYASSAIFYYRSLFYLNRYRKKDVPEYRDRFLQNLGVALLFHTASITDAVYIGITRRPAGWQGQLLGDEPLKSPWGATLRSAILPGWGQLYNETYWKALLYLGIDGYLAYKIREADVDYQATREGKFRDRRSRYSWYFGLAYMITLMDAHVGAYLYKFDEAVELAMEPTLIDNHIGIVLYARF